MENFNYYPCIELFSHIYIIFFIPETTLTFDKYYFDLESEGQYKCKECSEIVQSTEEDQSSLFDHIKENHPDEILAYQEDEDADFNIVIFNNDDVTMIKQ